MMIVGQRHFSGFTYVPVTGMPAKRMNPRCSNNYAFVTDVNLYVNLNVPSLVVIDAL